jgi:hypothetical protein
MPSITDTTALIAAEQAAERQRLDERHALTGAMTTLDEAIEACEQEHLGGEHEAPPEVVEQARAAIVKATEVTRAAAPPSAAALSQPRATLPRVLDALFDAQEHILAVKGLERGDLGLYDPDEHDHVGSGR